MAPTNPTDTLTPGTGLTDLPDTISDILVPMTLLPILVFGLAVVTVVLFLSLAPAAALPAGNPFRTLLPRPASTPTSPMSLIRSMDAAPAWTLPTPPIPTPLVPATFMIEATAEQRSSANPFRSPDIATTVDKPVEGRNSEGNPFDQFMHENEDLSGYALRGNITGCSAFRPGADRGQEFSSVRVSRTFDVLRDYEPKEKCTVIDVPGIRVFSSAGNVTDLFVGLSSYSSTERMANRHRKVEERHVLQIVADLGARKLHHRKTRCVGPRNGKENAVVSSISSIDIHKAVASVIPVQQSSSMPNMSPKF